mmetsp:Transcript_7508/g.7087  ORF Transcript_7508/g.7087 Transcript_7508/m.7087 type:complete len:142 (-) Transcript_7508:232-657(-)|eukprot:CAMPEP_0197824122 /NCGR_PEP_ID=MMETSP1437-20131217/1425_1 /TAXON_ID=49252 ORGANISM="Eucampia antarctica, Strain CCMP1452" /NCGR_SAMPLE_ID=MMETSP1437 /ASSEMBLY_ACC=CAM_ASM_001096 /LENGTH=141 /DNA_ID=CAMNT_0043423631 /DNA_START=85 /DNA_END=510 /DNA_ORIENTATION=-
MASPLMSVALRMFPRSGAAATTTGANSWATVSLWRRFFQLKEEEEEEQLEVLCEVLEESRACPVASDEANQARHEFLQGHYRTLQTASNLTSTMNSNLPDMQTTSSGPNLNVMRERENQVLHQPNLDIPVQNGYGYVNVAQ